MQDYLYVSFFLGHKHGEEARRLLRDCGLLELAVADRTNRNSWLGSVHFGVSIRLPIEDARLEALLERLRVRGVVPLTRLDREYEISELDGADWLVMRVATAGLWGGVDYGQAYDFSTACPTCGAGARLTPPLLAELGKLGKKDIDHLVYEGHLIVTGRVVDGLQDLTGFVAVPVKSPRLPPDARFSWLMIDKEFPPMHSSSAGYTIEGLCPTCGRAGHYRNPREAEVPTYGTIPTGAGDFNHTWEYFGNWRQVRSESHTRPIGGSRGVVVSQRARQTLLRLGVRRLVWVPAVVVG